MFIDSLLNPIAALINHGIDANDQAQDLCEKLDGRSLRIVAKPLPNPILMTSADGALAISSDAEHEADAEITGSLIELNRLMFIDSRAPLREGHVEISGDVDTADCFRELLLSARPDLEEKLADWFGVSMASQLSNFFRDTRDWAADITEDLTERATDFLHDESGQFPARKEINAHFAAVDEFGNAVERLEARLAQLNQATETEST